MTSVMSRIHNGLLQPPPMALKPSKLKPIVSVASQIQRR